MTKMAIEAQSDTASQAVAWRVLDKLLGDFGISLGESGSKLAFTGHLPALRSTHSEKINLSLVGALPAAANALVAAQIHEFRGGAPQNITVDLGKGHNYIDPNIGMNPSINGQEITVDLVIGNPYLRKIYETKDGRFVVPSAVYVDLAYQWSSFLSCSMNENDVKAAIKKWDSQELEEACGRIGMPLAVVRSEEEWLSSEQGRCLAQQAIVPVQRTTPAPKKPLSSNPRRPLEGLKVLCMTHAIAGPSAGRTLAEHGASVLQIMYTHGFEHNFVYTYANLGCASSRLNLHKEQDREHLWNLVRDADVWIDSYRDGALSKFGFEDEKLHEANASLIISHVRVYGTTGPWASRPGFDMQGSAVSGMMVLCGDGIKAPAWPPGMVINDYTTGYYGALAIQATVLRRMKEGGGYILSPSLAGTAMSIVRHFKSSGYPELSQNAGEPLPPGVIERQTGVGYLKTLRPLPELDGTPIKYDPILLDPMGSNLPVFPGFDSAYDPRSVNPIQREKMLAQVTGFGARMDRLREAGRGTL